MEALAENVIRLLGSLVAKELDLLCNLQDDLETMKRKVTGIKAVLRDAERKATKNEAINDWLQKLRAMLLDAEDLLDAYSAEELGREVMTKGKMAKEVRIFFSKSNQIVCAHKMGRKFRAIRKKLDEIYDESNPLQLDGSISSTWNECHEWRLTDSFVSEQDVVGRDKERMHLVRILLNPDVKNDVSVVPIVGIGGLGKTTLAQQVYNDVAVKNHFELMMWVCVSDESHQLSNNTLAQKIIKQETSDGALERLKHEIEKKHFLLVLDDVWNIKDRGEWLKLENLFRNGRKGSMTIVTTRSMEVVNTMGTDQPLFLKDLDEDNSWELFCRVAFQDGKEPADHKLVGIGKDIVRKCAGVPLAIRTIGSLLFNKALEVSEWSYFRDSELANIDSEDNKIFSILKLSYDHLPFYLKNCFAFCSLFPKNYKINRETLIQLWIAEGFIQPLDENRRLEDVGDEYFKQLLSRCLFQDVRKYTCKMHDLIHDLAQSVAKNECYIVTSEKIEEEKFGDGIRHMSSHFHGACKFSLEFIGNLTSLQSLDLSGSTSLSIGNLTSLLSLHLSGCTSLASLPESIGNLISLRSLNLLGCTSLASLPESIGNLTSLRS
ncbi:putative disease resistance protein RGA4, partial [Neltuma alba]|uniref:putative disease resistance protein RGA4 n=1 Tax=Neltuma alba TaxID=207710 RepID=UPI0010A2E9EF